MSLLTREPDELPRFDLIYRNGNVLGIVYGIPAIAAVVPKLPEGAEEIVRLYVPARK